MKVAVLGCGPAGLVSAHACFQRSINCDIYSKKRKSFLFGSQYLHEPIPGVPSDQTWVKYLNYGAPEEYRRKTHGKFWDGIISPEDFETEHHAWNIRQAYDWLWFGYGRKVMDVEINKSSIHNLAPYDLVISSVPRTIWKLPGEEFIYSEGWAMGDAPEQGVFVPDSYVIPEDTIICDGREIAHHNRLSNVFGYRSIEWPADVDEQTIADLGCNASKFTKPLRYKGINDNPANAQNWLHVGRYGKWEKGIVVSDAWNDVNRRLDEML